MSVSERIESDNGEVTVALLEAIGDAFNRHDVDAIIGFFAEDGIFDHALGPDIHGARYVGRESLRAFIIRVNIRPSSTGLWVPCWFRL